MKTLIRNIGLLATPEGFCARRGPAQGQLRLLNNAWVLAEDGIITAVGQGEPPCGAEQIIDGAGRLATPGLADAHTHLIFGGWRQDELADKLHGVPYLDILARGGGILSTVRATRAATEAELLEKGRRALLEMQRFGVTACEAKSGYGLETETELRQLRVIRQLGQECAMDLAPTLLGAHALPPEYQADREGYLRLLCEEMIPRAAAEGLARFCDVFCEEGVFTVEEARRILLAGKAHGLLPKLHADEIHPIGGSQLAGELGAVSAEHLIVCPEEGMERMARSGVIACLLPCTSLYLGASFAPARRLVEKGVAIAIATDFNPGSCPCLNLQLAMSLGCLYYRLTPEEVLTAVTLNGAAAMGLAGRLGSVEPGKQCDLALWDAPDLNYLCYRMGSNLCTSVIKNAVRLF
mgnify:FL=1